jgi:hypothetical protein
MQAAADMQRRLYSPLTDPTQSAIEIRRMTEALDTQRKLLYTPMMRTVQDHGDKLSAPLNTYTVEAYHGKSVYS